MLFSIADIFIKSNWKLIKFERDVAENGRSLLATASFNRSFMDDWIHFTLCVFKWATIYLTNEVLLSPGLKNSVNNSIISVDELQLSYSLIFLENS